VTGSASWRPSPSSAAEENASPAAWLSAVAAEISATGWRRRKYGCHVFGFSWQPPGEY